MRFLGLREMQSTDRDRLSMVQVLQNHKAGYVGVGEGKEAN